MNVIACLPLTLPVLLLCILLPGQLHATGSDTTGPSPFTLFSKDRQLTPAGNTKKTEVGKKTMVPAAPKKSKFIYKKYTLRGTTILGQTRYALLQQVGKPGIFSVRLGRGSATPFPDDPRYQLEKVEPGRVTIRYPLAVPCSQDDPAHGITCSKDQKKATLELVRLAAASGSDPKTGGDRKELAQKQQSNIIGSFPDAVSSGEKKMPEKDINPFLAGVKTSKEEQRRRLEKMRQDPDYQKRKTQYKNYKPRRIRKEDVPPGMKILQTPFGDILSPE